MDSSLKFIGLWFSIIRVYDLICLHWLQPFPLWWNIICTESIKFTSQDSRSGCSDLQREKFWKAGFRKNPTVMTPEIALLMVCSAACAFGHLLLSPCLYLSLTLMRTFLLPSPDYWVVMTHAGRLGEGWRPRAEFLQAHRLCPAWGASVKLPLMEKKSYITAVTLSVYTWPSSSSAENNR